MPRINPARLTTLALITITLACDTQRAAPDGTWAGTIDTLPSQRIDVRNPRRGAVEVTPGWRVVEELRIGGADATGPDVFGGVFALDTDAAGHLWILDGRAQELRVFDASGRHIRTVGRPGSGPGEFSRAVAVERTPDGQIWVTDPGNSRLSEFDTTGAFRRAVTVPLGCLELPWPGRFDATGRYYASAAPACQALLRFGTDFAVESQLARPLPAKEPDVFVVNAPGGQLMADIPFQGMLVWRIAPSGVVWGLITDEYRLFALAPAGDTVRAVRQPMVAEPLSDADRKFALATLEWFTDEGGRVEMSRLPRLRPPTTGFFVADNGELWVQRYAGPESLGHYHDVFDPEGRFLATVRVPFPVPLGPGLPVVRNGYLYAATADSLGAPRVVRARVVRPAAR